MCHHKSYYLYHKPRGGVKNKTIPTTVLRKILVTHIGITIIKVLLTYGVAVVNTHREYA